MPIRETSGRRGGSRTAVAVDIGLTAVHVAEVAIGGDRARLLKRASAPIVPPWDNLEASRDSLASAIRAAMAGAGIQSRDVVTCLPRRLVTLKHARLPHGSPDQIAGMVRFEAQQYIPFPIDEVVLDHRIVSDESDEMTTALIAAARKPLVDQFLAVFDKADLNVQQLSVSSLALSEHVRAGAVPIAILQVEAGEMDMAVAAAGRVLFSRSALLPGDGTGLDIQGLAGEVVRSLTAYQNEYRALPVSQVLLVGDHRLVDDAERELQALVETPVKRLVSELMPAPDAEALDYATGTGLALQRDGASIAGVNLVPPEREERKVAARRRVQMGLALAAALVVLAFGGTTLARSLQAQQKERADARAANAKLRVIEERLKSTGQKYDVVAANHKTLTVGLWHSRPSVDIIKAVSDAVPKDSGVYLTQLQYERTGNVILHGSAKSETAATDFVLALQRTGAFADVRLGYIGDAQSDNAPTAGGLPGLGNGAARLQVAARMNYIINCRMAAPPADQGKQGPQGAGAGSQVASTNAAAGGSQP